MPPTLHDLDQINANRAADEFWGDWVDCYACGGEGLDDTMCECERVVDICFCLRPQPVECQVCHGDGGWSPQKETVKT